MGGPDTKVELLLHKGGQQEIIGDKWRSEKDSWKNNYRKKIREVRGEGCCEESKIKEDEGLKDED